MPKPYNDCIDIHQTPNTHKSNLYDYLIENYDNYMQKICSRLTIHQEYYEKCNCSTPNFYKKKNLTSCYSEELKECISEVDYYYYDPQKFNYFEKYSKLCPLECDSQTYGIHTRLSKYPPSKVSDLMQEYRNKPFTLNRTNTFTFSIFYEDLKYLEITQYPKSTFPDLLSSMGGTCGLFLGLSFLSFMEVVELLIEILLIIWDKALKPDPENWFIF